MSDLLSDKHIERIHTLIDLLDDYEFNANFKRNDEQISEHDAIGVLRRRLQTRLIKHTQARLGNEDLG